MPGSGTKETFLGGDIISGFTGLATDKQIENERRERHETNLKVKKLIEHELVVEHAIEKVAAEVKRTDGVVKVMAELEHEYRLDTLYYSRKVSEFFSSN